MSTAHEPAASYHAEQERLTQDLYKQLDVLTAVDSTGLTHGAYVNATTEILNMDGDVRVYLQALIKGLTDETLFDHSPRFMLAIVKVVHENGGTLDLTGDSLDTAEELLEVLQCHYTHLGKPLVSRLATEATKIVHHVLTSPDRGMLASIFKERRFTTLDALLDYTATQQSLAVPLRNGAL